MSGRADRADEEWEGLAAEPQADQHRPGTRHAVRKIAVTDLNAQHRLILPVRHPTHNAAGAFVTYLPRNTLCDAYHIAITADCPATRDDYAALSSSPGRCGTGSRRAAPHDSTAALAPLSRPVSRRENGKCGATVHRWRFIVPDTHPVRPVTSPALRPTPSVAMSSARRHTALTLRPCCVAPPAHSSRPRTGLCTTQSTPLPVIPVVQNGDAHTTTAHVADVVGSRGGSTSSLTAATRVPSETDDAAPHPIITSHGPRRRSARTCMRHATPTALVTPPHTRRDVTTVPQPWQSPRLMPDVPAAGEEEDRLGAMAMSFQRCLHTAADTLDYGVADRARLLALGAVFAEIDLQRLYPKRHPLLDVRRAGRLRAGGRVRPHGAAWSDVTVADTASQAAVQTSLHEAWRRSETIAQEGQALMRRLRRPSARDVPLDALLDHSAAAQRIGRRPSATPQVRELLKEHARAVVQVDALEEAERQGALAEMQTGCA